MLSRIPLYILFISLSSAQYTRVKCPFDATYIHKTNEYSMDEETGEILWEINLGSAVTGFPVSYAVDGRQYVAVSTGTASTASMFTRLTPEIRPSAGNNLFVFALPPER